VANIRINGKVNLKDHFDQEERAAMINHKIPTNSGPLTNIRIIQNNLIGDFDEIIAEKRIYACLLHTDIKSPLYHIEKLSELIGKAKTIIKSKVYKIDRRTALQKAIDLFRKVKDRLSIKVLDELKIASKRKISETNTKYDGSTRLERNEDFNRNILDSIILNRQRLAQEIPAAFSEEPSEKSESKSSEDLEYCGNLWSRNRLSSTSNSSYQPMQDDKNPLESWANLECPQNVCEATPCISPPLPRVTPLYPPHSVETNNFCSATPCISPPLPNVTPLYTCWDAPPPLPQKSPEPQPPIPMESTRFNDPFFGHYPTPNVFLDELEHIQDTLENLGNFENYDGKSSDCSEGDNPTKHYYYVDGELTEFTPTKHKKPNQSVGSVGTSENSSKSEYDDWKFPKLTEANVAKFMDMLKPAKKLENQKVSKFFMDELDKKLKLISKKVEATKRKIDDVDDKKEDKRNPKKTKTEPKKTKKVVREKKLYVKESPEIKKILKKYTK